MLRKFLLTLVFPLLALQAGWSVAAPMPAPTCFEPKKFDTRFIGNWEIVEWNVRYSIRAKGRQVCMYARDAEGDEWFEISGLKWEGNTLSAKFLMPSTKWRTQSWLTLVDGDKIRDDYTNKDGKKTDFWTRRK